MLVKLTQAEAEQIRFMIRSRQREGWYLGNKEHFEKREEYILKLLNDAEVAQEKGCNYGQA